MHRFVKKMGWYDSASRKKQTPRNLAISLAIETAEVLEHLQWSEEIKNKEAFGEELADVALYLLQLASITGIDLEKAILAKLEKNYHRTWNENQ